MNIPTPVFLTVRQVADKLIRAGFRVTGTEEGDDQADGMVSVHSPNQLHVQVPTFGGSLNVVYARGESYVFCPLRETWEEVFADLREANKP